MRTPLAAVVPALLVAAVPAQDKPRGMDYGPTMMTTFEGGGVCRGCNERQSLGAEGFNLQFHGFSEI